MRRILLTAAMMGLAGGAAAQGWGSSPPSTTVRPYTTPQGTYVPQHQRTMPNHTPQDNWTTRGNTNPYTGQPGTRTPPPFGYSPAPSYGAPRRY